MAKGGESDIQSAIMSMLLWHPKVAWAFVTTTGVVNRRGSYITVGVKGMPDILGQLKTGQLFGIEVKKPKEKPSDDQYKFINMIVTNGGVAGWATSIEEAMAVLK